MEQQDKPIGIFDSGVGGISVLRAAVRELPHEDFCYFGDSANAPYGPRSTAEVQRLSEAVVTHLLTKGVKAIVIACNTATSAAATLLRQKYPALPIIGIEPAVKPAVERHPGQQVVVMATPLTLREEKFTRLAKRYRQQADIVPLAAPDLVEFVEAGATDTPAVHAYLHKLLAPYATTAAAVVLGCTHFPFVRAAIAQEVRPGAPIIDGGAGTARELRRQLEAKQLLNSQQEAGRVVFENSTATSAMIQLSERLFNEKND